MMKIGCILLVISMSFLSNEREKQIVHFLDSEFALYPESRLTDIYKSYFQDAFGPGHMIPDTTRSGFYLDKELKDAVLTDTLKWQAVGTNHDYYRINLMLVKNKTIPRDTLLLGMVRSARLARKPDLESWKKEWMEVLEVVKKKKPGLPGLKEDQAIINQVLEKGEVVMHHSPVYENTYHPHYRIIHRKVFESWAKRYLNK